MSNCDPGIDQIESADNRSGIEHFDVNSESEIERLRAENAALKLALSTAQRERDEWRIVAQQCAPLGGEIEEDAKTVEKL